MKKRIFFLAAILIAVLVLPLICSAALDPITDLTSSHDYDPGLYIQLSWGATTNLDPADTGAEFVYAVYARVGRAGFTTTSDSWLIGTTNITSYKWYPAIPRDYSFIVRAEQVAGTNIGDFIYSNVEINQFLYSVGRADASGGQAGVGQQWRFTYKMKDDARVNLFIYEPGTILNWDIYGHPVHDPIYSGSITKKVVDWSSRSFEMPDKSWVIEDVWDCRTNTGVLVPNGIYWFLIEPIYKNALVPDTAVGTYWFTIPVDILRVSDISATEITTSMSTSYISYYLSGNAAVYVKFYNPNTQFDTAGNPVDPSDQIDTLVLYRGEGTHIESWGGTTDTGALLPNQLYIFSIRAYDVNYNASVDTQGNDCPMFGSIAIDRTTPEAGSTSDSSPPSIVSTNPTNGQALTATINQVSATLSDTGGAGLDLANSAITLTDPDASPVAGSQSNNGSNIIYWDCASSLSKNGNYTITVTARDGNSNVTGPATYNFTLSITTADTMVFPSTVHSYPNPAKGVNQINFSYYLTSAPAQITVEVYTVLGELVWSYNVTDSVTGYRSVSWDCQNSSGALIGSDVYIYRIIRKVGSTTTTVTKKLVYIR